MTLPLTARIQGVKPEGELSEIEVLPLLIELSRQTFTGAVRFEREAMIKIVYFREGDVLSASTNDPRDAIDETLVRAGKITRDHVRQAIARRKENESIADALVTLGFLTRKELTWARRLQLVGILRSVTEWRDGSYGIVQDYLPKRDEGTLFHLPQIIVETVVTDSDRARVERQTDGGAATYQKTSAFDDGYRRLGLNEDANVVLGRIDGKTPASDLMATSTEEPFSVLKLLVAMELLGLIERVDKPQVTHELSLVADELPPMAPLEEPQVVHEIREVPDEPEHPRYVALERTRSRTVLLVLLLLVAVAVISTFVFSRRADVGVTGPASTTEPPPAATVASETSEPEPPAVAVATEPPLVFPPLPPDSSASEALTTGVPEPPVASPESSGDPGVGTRDSAPPPQRELEANTPERDLRRERYDVMAESFARENAAVPYSLQIELVCQTESIRRALEIGGDRIWFTPIQFRGQSCYRVFWGSYLTRTAAEQAVAEVPPAFTEGSRPSVIEVREVLKP